MQRSLKRISTLATLAVIGLALAPAVSADPPSQEQLTVRFLRPTFFEGVLLQGDYLFVHDPYKMAREEPCLFVYEGRARTDEKAIASVHAKLVEHSGRAVARVETERVSEGVLWSLSEIQFPGATGAHHVR